MNDIIVIGGGISGLYTAYKLSYQYPKMNIKIIEKGDRLGGRIHTYKDANFQIEAGAGRISSKNVTLLALLKELNLDKYLVPIVNDFQIVDIKQPGVIQKSNIFTYLKIILSNVTEDKETLQNITFIDYIKMKLSVSETKYLLDFFGYTSELTVMNAADSIDVMKTYFSKGSKYFILSGGLSQIVDSLTEILQARQVKITKKTEVTNVVFDSINRVFDITTKNKKKERSKYCFCAVTKDFLDSIRIFQPIYKYLKYIETKPLCRIYAKYDRVWFKGLTKITTNSPLKYIIPIDETQGIIMISYTDEKHALYWKNLYDKEGSRVLKRTIQGYIKQMFDIDTPLPKALKMFFWERGAAYFTKGFDSSTMTKAIMVPNPEMPLYVCGENYSENNTAWIEGGLNTSTYVMKQHQKFMKSEKAFDL